MFLGEQSIRGKGYGIDTVMTIARFAFEELGLKRLDTTIISYNKSSIGVYAQKCGWKIEGVKETYYFRKNQWWDQLIVGITEDDYLQLIKENNYWNDNK